MIFLLHSPKSQNTVFKNTLISISLTNKKPEKIEVYFRNLIYNY